MKILFSNIGYAKGIDGSLWQHATRAGRHIFTRRAVQLEVLRQLKDIVAREQPDICCFVEIDSGSFHASYLNQMAILRGEDYGFYDMADKYGAASRLGRMPLHAGKCNGFMAKQELAFERLYFEYGTKRLIYKIILPDDRVLLFAHFSLQRKIREKQFGEINRLRAADARHHILMADFNIMQGFGELAPLLQDGKLRVLNRETEPTFLFHRRKLALDLCLCSGEAPAELQIVPQPFSDHDALILQI